VAKLVERLTYERLLSDTNYASNFLATFRSFLSPHDFLDLIVMRYNMPRPKNANAEILQKFRELKETPIRLRVFNTLKLWLDRFFSDFRDDPTLLDKLNVFVVNAVQLSNPKFANALQLLIQKQSQVVPAIGLAPPKEPPAYLVRNK
jgi:son of sevenless-like protein